MRKTIIYYNREHNQQNIIEKYTITENAAKTGNNNSFWTRKNGSWKKGMGLKVKSNRRRHDVEIVNKGLDFWIGDLDELCIRIGEIVREMNFNPSRCTLSSICKWQLPFEPILDWWHGWLWGKIANLSFWFSVPWNRATRCHFGPKLYCPFQVMK